MSETSSLWLGIMIGAIAGLLMGGLAAYEPGQTIYEVRKDYERCLNDGGPKDRCIKKYFIGLQYDVVEKP